MDASFIPIEVVPSKTPFGLDQLRRSYKTSLSAADAIAACPAVGTADETFEFMFLMPINTPESAESATRVDLVYQGCLQDDGEGNPILPNRKNDDTDSVQSASSSKGALSSVTLTSPLTVQYYAPSKTLTWFTFESLGEKGTVDDPTRAPEIITVVLSDISYTPTSGGLPGLVAIFFTQQIVDTIQSNEIVPGKYWQNIEQKTNVFIPYIVDLPPGFYPVPASGGSGYVIGDTITVSFSGTCVMEVVAIYVPSGTIRETTITSNSLSVATGTPQPATGGSGSGATYTIIEIPA